MRYEVDFKHLGLLLNKWIKDIWDNRSRYIVCKGGGGSGKSYGIAQLLVYRMIAEQGHKVLVVRKVANTLRESCFSLIQEVISLYGCQSLFKINKSDMTIECINGNKFIFRGMDDPEKIKSINAITDIWIEEASELAIEDFRQLNIRLRGKSKYPKQFFMPFNPVSATHWLKKEFFDNKKSDAVVIETTYKDNKFLDDEAIKVLEDFKDTDPYYYDVYCLGMWGVTGNTIFDTQKVNGRIAQIQGKKPIKQGYFTYNYINERIVDSSIKWVNDDSGAIRIYEEPKKNYPYVGGGDTAGDGSDNFALQVIDNTNCNQVATLHNQYDEDLYAKQVYCLGKYYNYALLGIETNFSTYPVKELQRLRYMRQFYREVEDTITLKKVKSFGFNTNKLTRPLIISELVEIVREQPDIFNDLATLNEMLTFVRNSKGRPEAQSGAHDDLIMAMAITFYIRTQQSMTVFVPSKNNYEAEYNDYTGY